MGGTFQSVPVDIENDVLDALAQKFATAIMRAGLDAETKENPPTTEEALKALWNEIKGDWQQHPKNETK